MSASVLSSSAFGGGGGGAAERVFAEQAVNALTVQLLDCQAENARLTARIQQLEARDRATSQSSPDQSRTVATRAAQSLAKELRAASLLDVQLDASTGGDAGGTTTGGGAGAGAGAGAGGGAGAGAGDAASETPQSIAALLSEMHKVLDAQQHSIVLRQDAGLATVKQSTATGVLGRMGGQLRVLEASQARRQSEEEALLHAEDDAAVAALGDQIAKLQAENGELRRAAEVMQEQARDLTERSSDTSKLQQELSNLESVHKAMHSAMQSQVDKLRGENGTLAAALQESEAKNMKLQNRIDELHHIHTEKTEIERHYLAQQRQLVRVHAEREELARLLKQAGPAASQLLGQSKAPGGSSGPSSPPSSPPQSTHDRVVAAAAAAAAATKQA